jgi:predicted HAD superfamily hydrolase
VTIEEIYQNFENGMGDLSSKDLMELELQVEASVLRPVSAIQKMVSDLRAKGERIVFTSDHYLPANFIKEQLERNGFYKDGDGLYVSQEIGLTKSTGKLFDYVKEKEGTDFAQIRHYGDNLYADLQIPRSKGIRAYLVDTGFNRYEHDWSNHASAARYPVDIYLISGIAKSLRLSGSGNVHDNLVLNNIAPMFVPFVSWLFRDARERGITTLYFLARDGYILYEIAKILGVNYPEIQVRYLFGSRRAFYIAGLTTASREEFQWIMAQPYGKTPRQMLLRINTTTEAIAAAMVKLNVGQSFLDNPLDKESYELFLDILTERSSQENILAISLKHRLIVKDYFRQEGLFGEGAKAVVDIGWSRFCQRVMNVVLEQSRAFGYFFSVFDERLDMQEAGSYAAAFIQKSFTTMSAIRTYSKMNFYRCWNNFLHFPVSQVQLV